MTTDANKKLITHYLKTWGLGDTERLLGMLAKDCVTHNLATGKELGIEFEKEACEIWHAAFDNTRLRIDKLVAEDDLVSAYWTLTGKHCGTFMDIAPTRKMVSVPGMEINRLENGKIVEIWRLSDTMSLMQQLGAVPARV